MLIKVISGLFAFTLLSAGAGLWFINEEWNQSKSSLIIASARIRAAQEEIAIHQESKETLSSLNLNLSERLRASSTGNDKLLSENVELTQEVRRVNIENREIAAKLKPR